MLKKVSFKNFKCLQDVTVDLEPLTVLIGPNNAGKTSFLQALDLFRQATIPKAFESLLWNHRDSRLDQWVWMGNKSQPLRFACDVQFPGQEEIKYFLTFEQERANWTITEIGSGDKHTRFSKGGQSKPQLVSHGQQIAIPSIPSEDTILSCLKKPDGVALPGVSGDMVAMYDLFHTMQTYHLHTEAMIQPVPLKVGEVPSLRADGYGLPIVLDWLLNEHREAFYEIEKQLRELAPSLSGISLPLRTIWKATSNVVVGVNGPESVGKDVVGKGLEFVLADSGGKKISAAEVSEGVLLLLGYLTILHHPHAPDILLIEEPDNHIHPRRVEFVFKKLREISQGQLGKKPCQIILTTHNPLFLNFARPEEVRIFTRTKRHATQITSMRDVKNIEALLASMDLGELWYNLGEEQLVTPA